MREARRRSEQFERTVRADLARRRWLRVHAFLLGTACFLLTWLISAGLMHAGVERLALRWTLALAGGYLVFLGLLWCWCRWLLSREEADADLPLDALDAIPSGHGV
jgi:cytosine/uracil/thiamine/allantoin permease